ncbi:hypothetical protein [Halobellus limi]|uniref:hypothetical protein n=1 Tax=Halobellus limi TaxID=699433 RepID=UPI0010A566FC|nr:hypothetical protein [Halobellus limi]
MPDDQSPFRELLEGVIPINKISDTVDLLRSPRWRDFFIMIYGVGLVFSICSVAVLILIALFAQVSTSNGALGSLKTFFLNAGIPILAIWFLANYIARAVNATIEPRLPFEDEAEELASHFDKYQGRPAFETLVTIIHTLTFFLSLKILILYRNNLIVPYPDVTDISTLAVSIVIFSFDLGYIGLFLCIIYQSMEFLLRLYEVLIDDI